MCILSSILLFLALPICYAEARTPLELPIQDSIRSEQDECNAVKNKPLQAVMDRVCELCHDMYSHQIVNMRALC
uniref:Uncharacterized protein n=1 Tax=Acrobeloides nanus TaxID=290746 RepID=A0A914DWD9_9BILA